jgi:O-acetyl-ADP-ribose deacetylase
MAILVTRQHLETGQQIELFHGDLTEERVDAIVNAANEYLHHGGGVAGAIVRRGGESIQVESTRWVQCHGTAGHSHPALTGAGRLPCRHVIHAVGPVWGSGDEDSKLRVAYTAALELAEREGFASVAFPSISTGIFGFSVERGASIALQAAVDFCQLHPGSALQTIRFTVIDPPTVDAFRREFERRWPKAAAE